MSQRANKKAPSRTPSVDPSEKVILFHCRLRDVPENTEVIGLPTPANPDSIVFACGSKLDTKLIYVNFKEATNYSTFKKYVNKYLVPCYSRPWGKNGKKTNIYNGKSDYTILEEDEIQEVHENEPPKVAEDNVVVEEAVNQRVNEDVQVVDENFNQEVAEIPGNVQVVEEIGETPQQVQINRKRTHEDDEIQVLASVSKEKTPENDKNENEEINKVPTPKRRKVHEPADEVVQDVQVDEEAVETPQKVQRHRKRTHEIEVSASVSDEKTSENDKNEDEDIKNPAPKRQRVYEAVDETPKNSIFARSEPVYIAPQGLNLSLDIPENNDQHPLDFTPIPDDEQQEPSDFTLNSSHATIPPLDVGELERQQQLENIENTRSWFNYNTSEEKFIKDHMFDPRSPELALGAAGIDPYDIPSCVVQHMNPTFFSASNNLNRSDTPILSQSIEIDDEPEDDEDGDETEEYVEVSRPKAKSSCSLM